MANPASNRSPSPLSSRNCKNFGTNPTPRASFNGRPNALINPKSSNPPTPSNTPTVSDHIKRNLINRKSTSSLFQDGKENHKDALRSPAKMGSKNFMAPTISAASKFTPSPRKKILGDKNDATRASIQFFDKDSELKSDLKMNDESKAVEEKENVSEHPVVKEVILSSTKESVESVEMVSGANEATLSSTEESNEMVSGCTEDSDVVSIRPSCCSPISSPIVAPLESDPNLPPYDPKKNFLSPRPQFLRYKPNPRIENLLNKDGSDDLGEDDVTQTLEGSFNMSENSDTEVEEQESELGDSVHGSLESLSEKVLEEKQPDSKVERTSKARFFTGSKAFWFMFLMFLVGCYSVTFTDSPPLDLPIYKDVGFTEIYHETLKFAGFAKESFDVLVEDLKNRSIDFVSYISHLKSELFPIQQNRPIMFFNLTTSVQEEVVFNRHIGTDYIQEIQELEEEMSDETELIEEEDEVDDIDVADEVDDIDVVDEVVNEQPNGVQSDDINGFVETKSVLEDGSMSKSEPIYKAQSEALEAEVNDLEIASDAADYNNEPETMRFLSTKSLERICFAGFPMVMIAVCAIFYMSKRKSNAKKRATIRAADDITCEESCSSSVGNKHKKKTSNNKRESLAISSSDFSMGCSYGSFTTLERIPIKKKDEVILTPIRRSSRLLKNQVL